MQGEIFVIFELAHIANDGLERLPEETWLFSSVA